MKRRKAVSVLLVMAMAASMLTGCGGENTTGTNGAASTEGGSSGENTNDSSGVKEFTAFFAVPGSEINDDNEKMQGDMADRPDCTGGSRNTDRRR